MRKMTIYLDTSVINFLFADDAPEKKDITVDFFDHYVLPHVYEVYVSVVVIDEISRTKNDHKREMLLATLWKYNVKVVPIEDRIDEIEELAKSYIASGIIPEKKIEDALHIAICTVFEMDVLLSWNYKHLANVNKERLILSANLLEGYSKQFRMATPMEVMYEEE
jgi:predicted nucleic acid-binding protein